ncbi:hypothetical protein LTR10_024025 [Elasticomyces elasticus]|uniref:amidase n=1 Tax=Exophiala sideris TaxID=1016849 RepID=A0ABR0JL36_9EURO|nr:hypothetical protein LTR10_024025 [Elasticomyces elasticus]KAK5035452.1 hypothetical protein LTS07_002890 [Exophiala sideris]KAK5039197.1 hypothetical protein LTR13_003453 [Exophiala sideris]KAK5066377.1 hypothetical protein LTR69_002896 [Exophiala sideris]KAK5187054.1 hypothetical protein LTR44_001061 [Eurotiomycetes sp. CCFEE 6388]
MAASMSIDLNLSSKDSEPPASWQKIAQKAQLLRDSTIPREWLLGDPVSDDVRNVIKVPYTCGIMAETELALTDKDATSLLELLKSGRVGSYDVTFAFCKRAAIAHQLVNCMTEMWFDEALDRARELDRIFADSGPVGAFHGLPFSIKNTFAVKGRRSDGAYVAWYDNIAKEDGMLVKIIRDEGAVLYCKTTNPQTAMHLETTSNLYGRTLNPFNRMLTPGGSSGGEAALLAMRGSPIGLGGDGGGSIRSPAANNGLFGMKATSDRIPFVRGTSTMRGCKSFPIVAGPLCHSARDAELFMQTVLDTSPWLQEYNLVPLPWRQTTMPEKITIGLYVDDGSVMPHPPVKHALEALKVKLEADPRFEVIEWSPCKHDLGYDLIRQLYWEDGGVETMAIMESSGEPVLDLSKWVMKDSHVRPRTLKESWELNYQREEFQKEYLAHWLSAPTVPDFLVCPVGPSVAPRHETARYWGYTAIFNLLDYPAASFPTGLTASASIHLPDTDYVPRDTEFDEYNWKQYEPSAYEGAPISLQVVGRKWDCERVLKMAGMLNEVCMS